MRDRDGDDRRRHEDDGGTERGDSRPFHECRDQVQPPPSQAEPDR
jgi:hypothetical protein